MENLCVRRWIGRCLNSFAAGYRVEFLTSNRGSDDCIAQPANMPALGSASVDPLRFLDFLIRDPLRTILLHKSGVPVAVPDPARYAVHKMIVDTRRRADGLSAIERDKDIRQAEILFEAFYETRRASDFAIAFEEACRRGQAWQEALQKASNSMLSVEGQDALSRIRRQGNIEIGLDPPEVPISS